MGRRAWAALGSGLPFGMAGFLWGLYLTRGAEGLSSRVWAATVGSFLTGALVWWVLVLKPGHPPTARRGALVGALVGGIAHVPLVYFGLLHNWVTADSVTRGVLVNPVLALFPAVIYGLLSLLVTGWVTMPAGAAVGVALAWFQRRFMG